MPGRTFFPNRSKFITFAAAPLALTPFVPNQATLQADVAAPYPSQQFNTLFQQLSGKDKGGPSKCGFLNNELFSYTVLYLCNQ